MKTIDPVMFKLIHEVCPHFTHADLEEFLNARVAGIVRYCRDKDCLWYYVKNIDGTYESGLVPF